MTRDALDTFWAMDPSHLYAALGSSRSGLDRVQAQKRLAAVPRRLHSPGRPRLPRLFVRQLVSPIYLLLLLAVLIALVVHDYADALIILAILFVSTLLSAWQEYRANTVVALLLDRVRATATVRRNHVLAEVPLDEVVPGDVVLLSPGDVVPADGVVLTTNHCYVDEAILTGESLPVRKQSEPSDAEAFRAERSNVLYLGTSVRSGTAEMLVVGTGRDTEFGQIAARLKLRPPATEFEHGIRRFGRLVAEVTLSLVIVIFAVNVLTAKPILDSLLFSLAIAVGLTPQLLPAIISITLAKGSKHMASLDVIVRRPQALENFGSIDVLCTDKTGTLTRGEMTLDAALDAQGEPSHEVQQLAYATAHFAAGKANPLDAAIAAAGESHWVAGWEKHGEVPFDFVRKRMSVLVRDGDSFQWITKGAFESVLALCAQVQTRDGVRPLEDELRQELRSRFEQDSSEGFRLLAVATHDIEARDIENSEASQAGLTFRGTVRFADPPKSGVEAVLQRLNELQVGVKVITGDHPLVVAHLARTLGMPNTRVLTGREVATMRDEALWRSVNEVDLFAEIDPMQKERLVRACSRAGHVVGFLGDGINDVPALHTADIGISVDSATDVAKEAADVVLMRHDLTTLCVGIEQGRRTIANTLKYVQMAVSANFGNMFSVAAASIFLPYLPLLAKQVLMVNLLTDTPEMGIAGDRVDPEAAEKPRRWDIREIRRFMLWFGLLSAVFDFLTFGALLFLFQATPEVFRTGWFIESIVSATLIVLIIRTRRRSWRSRPSNLMLGLSAVSISVAITLPFSPFAGPLGLVPLEPQVLGLIALIVVLYAASAEWLKSCYYRSK